MNKCIFCQIGAGKIPAKIRFSDKKIVAFDDINPQAPIHILIIPKIHIPTTREIQGERLEIIGYLISKACDIAKQAGIDKTGFRISVNTGKDSGQIVEHLHFHLLGGKKLPSLG